MPGGPGFLELRRELRSAELHTVCEEARCPNIGDCWERKSATFMILGDVCTRACRYCAVTSGKPAALDPGEPARLARTVERLGLRYCVITSVDRDDLPDGGASVFSECIERIRERSPECKVEVLIPDFAGDRDALHTVLGAGPTVLNHNIETVRRVFKSVRAKGDYDLSLDLLARSRERAPHIPTKSGMMVGLGETTDEVLADRRAADGRPVPAPVARPRGDGPLLPPARVRGAGAGRARHGLQARRRGPARALVVPRGRAARGGDCGARVRLAKQR